MREKEIKQRSRLLAAAFLKSYPEAGGLVLAVSSLIESFLIDVHRLSEASEVIAENMTKTKDRYFYDPTCDMLSTTSDGSRSDNPLVEEVTKTRFEELRALAINERRRRRGGYDHFRPPPGKTYGPDDDIPF